MMYKLSNLQTIQKILFLYIFFLNINANSQIIEDDSYPVSLRLSNDNIFIITTKSITLYSPDFLTKKTIINFPDIILTSEIEQTSIAQFTNDDNYIISLIKNKLYVFDQNANYINNFDLSYYLNGKYYSLIPYKYENFYHYYLISFINTNDPKLSILYFKFHLNPDSNEFITQLSYIPTVIGFSMSLNSYGLSCELIKLENNEKITCFYEASFWYYSYLFSSSFEIKDNSINAKQNLEFETQNDGASIIKTAVSKDKSTVLICYIKYYSETYCLTYNLLSNSFSEYKKYHSKCKGSYLDLLVEYYSEINKYIFGCNDISNGFKIVEFDEDFKTTVFGINSEYQPNYNTNCFETNSFYVTHLNNDDHYSIIYDCKKSEGKFDVEKDSFGKIDDLSENTEIKEEEEVIEKEELEEKIEKIEKEEKEEKKEEEKEELEEKELEKEEKAEIEEEELNNHDKETNDTNTNTIKTKVNKTKEEFAKELDTLVKDVEKGKNYIIEGDDCVVVIKPIETYVEESSVHVDFSECETILRKYYNIPYTQQITFLQINIENHNKNCLNDQVEYKVYNEQGNSLDLSICKNVKIKIVYEIKSDSLNVTKIYNYQNLGVDIMNLNDNFFNDICYPYSNNENSDIVLTDRISDIYQNFSMCGDECNYDNFNVSSLEATCNCSVKTNVVTELEEGNFAKSIAVIKCYNLVFNFKGKLANIGFWIFLIITIAHIPIFIYYCKTGIDPLKEYIKNQMSKKGYLIRGGIIAGNNNINKNNKCKSTLNDKINNYIETERKDLNSNDNYSVSKHEYTINPKNNYDSSSNNNNSNPPLKKSNLNLSSNSLFSPFKKSKNSKYKRKPIKRMSEITATGNGNKIIFNKSTIEESIEIPEIEFNNKLSVNKNKINIKSKLAEKEIDSSNYNSSSINSDIENNYDLNKIPKNENFETICSDNIETNKKSLISKVPSILENINEKEEFKEYKNNNKKFAFSSNKSLIENDLINIDTRNNKNKNRNNIILFNRKNSNNYLKNNHKKRTSIIKFQYNNYLDISIIRPKNNEINKNKNKNNDNIKNNSEKNIKNKSLDDYILIRINANNIGNKLPLDSNYFLNNYTYEEAIKYDKRSFFRIYFIFLLAKENIINTFFFKIPLELKPLRICIFIFTYTCNNALNALFYTTGKISDKYHFKGKNVYIFTMLNNTVKSLITTLIGILLVFFFQSLINSNSKIDKLFKNQDLLLIKDENYYVKNTKKNEIKRNVIKILKCLRIKIIFFMIIEYLIILFFFYYVTAFCHVYKNTQISWILDCVVSFFISIIIEFAISFIFSLIYKISIKHKFQCLYKICLMFYGLT